ncbi:hypothetical protein N0V88_001656 [Collariella sp. IMI 366227]|nr:hypothetical protein N0V88_001656 [Collariella sp. IMI 366227]
MNSLRPAAQPLPFLGRLRTILGGGARYASTGSKVVVTTKSVAKQEKQEKPQKERKERKIRVPPKGHGERFWVYNHIQANHIVYSLTPELDINKAFRQFPYTGKKLVPAKLRKDYWRPLVLVEFGAGKGAVGRSVFHKLRELKKRHELEWDDPELLKMSKRDRGKALNDQRGNMVADLAAVLSGYGKGNRVVVEEEGKEEAKKPRKWEKKTGEVVPVDGVMDVKIDREGKPQVTLKLHPATVYWANEQDQFYAEQWTENVAHVLGVPEKQRKQKVAAAKPEEAAAPEAEAEAEAKPEAKAE